MLTHVERPLHPGTMHPSVPIRETGAQRGSGTSWMLHSCEKGPHSFTLQISIVCQWRTSPENKADPSPCPVGLTF